MADNNQNQNQDIDQRIQRVRSTATGDQRTRLDQAEQAYKSNPQDAGMRQRLEQVLAELEGNTNR